MASEESECDVARWLVGNAESIGKSQNTKGNARPRRKRQRKATLSLNASALTSAMASATQGNARQPEGNATVASKEDLNQGRPNARQRTQGNQYLYRISVPVPGFVSPQTGTGAGTTGAGAGAIPVRAVRGGISIPSITDVLERKDI